MKKIIWNWTIKDTTAILEGMAFLCLAWFSFSRNFFPFDYITTIIVGLWTYHLIKRKYRL